jgi:DNA-directed RNA polymerase subunit M/transcription elongation factor TFIIS
MDDDDDDSKRTRQMIITALSDCVPELAKEQIHALEVGVWNWALKEAGIRGNLQIWDDTMKDDYCRRAAHCATNLTRGPLSNGNTYLLDMVLSKKIEPYNIPFLEAEKINLPLMSKHLQKKHLRDHHDMSQYEAASAIFECPSCNAKKSRFRQLQTRSGDEGSTLFLTCLACGYEWTDSP